MQANPVARHKTAIFRAELSRPVKLALADGLIREDVPLFDYGCGRGGDVDRLREMGVPARGWDPVHRPSAEIGPSAIVNIGYVINVIENANERAEVLRKAWALARELLVVSARLSSETRALGEAVEFSDGCLTQLGTFQKFYEQHELKIWIEQTLGTSALPAGPGVFYVFRDEERRLAFHASKYRRRMAAPRRSKSIELFNEHEETLAPLMSFFADRGRLPADEEIENAGQVIEIFGSMKRAFRIVINATDREQWNAITDERAQELLIFLALSQFDGRPKFSRLPRFMQLDVKGFFSHYNRACDEADRLLFSLGDITNINHACGESMLGKCLPTALYIHVSALDRLAPVLRMYEGCARGLIGQVEEANLVKLDRTEPKISYLSYPNFEADPHPVLAQSVSVHLQTFSVKYRNFRHHRNPPILHRKDTFLAPEHDLYERFARLTRIQESKGLYNDTSRIGTRDGWEQVLMEKGVTLKGHRLVRMK